MKIVIGLAIWIAVAFVAAMLFGCIVRYGRGEKFDFFTWWKKR